MSPNTEERNMDETGPRTEAGRQTPRLNDKASRSMRVIARLPRLVTEADDYSWVPLGDVLLAVADPDHAAEGYPEGEPAPRLDGLLRYARIEAAARAWLTADQAYIEAPFGADEEEQAVAHVAKDELRASLRQGDSE